MNLTDYLINGILIGLVVLQVRGKRLTPFGLLIPLAVVGYVAADYLHGIPTAGNDLVLIAGGTVLGLSLGTACGMCTSVYRNGDGEPFAKASLVAAVFWVLGVGARLAFLLYTQNGGQDSIGRFSAAHHITSGQAWVACLVLMAIAEVIGRTGVLAWRRQVLLARPPVSTAIPARRTLSAS
jgi:hypothetical protein